MTKTKVEEIREESSRVNKEIQDNETDEQRANNSRRGTIKIFMIIGYLLGMIGIIVGGISDNNFLVVISILVGIVTKLNDIGNKIDELKDEEQ